MQARRPSSALLDTVKNVRKVFAGRTKSNHQLSKEQINEGMASSSSTFFQVRKIETYALLSLFNTLITSPGPTGNFYQRVYFNKEKTNQNYF